MADISFKPAVIRYPIATPQASSQSPSVYGFSMHKAGSTLLYNMLSELARSAGLTYYSISDLLYQQNVSDVFRPGDVGQPFRQMGFCYAGFRSFPAFGVPFLDSARIAFLVRDPRDMITSLYFSTRYSHVAPRTAAHEGAREELLSTRSRLQQVEIDAFAIETACDYVKEFEGYIAQGFHWRPNVATYRYEDVIFRKRDWVEHLCAWFGWTVPAPFKDRIATAFDVSVQDERPDQHIRQVSPGNYRKHLRRETAEAIAWTLREPMRLYGYA